jgi:hypothetical protein
VLYTESGTHLTIPVLAHPEKLTTADNVQDKGSISILTALQYSTTQELEVKTSGRTRLVTPTLRTKISWNDLPDSGEESTEGGSDTEDPLLVPSLRCGLLIHRTNKDAFCGRANTLAAYRELNQNVGALNVSYPLANLRLATPRGHL